MGSSENYNNIAVRSVEASEKGVRDCNMAGCGLLKKSWEKVFLTDKWQTGMHAHSWVLRYHTKSDRQAPLVMVEMCICVG